MKTCNKCDVELPLERFSIDRKNRVDGKCNTCKTCFRINYNQPKPYVPKPRNPELLKHDAPNLDEVLHCCAVKAADQLSALTMKEDLTNIDAEKMKKFIDILLLFRKKARPLNNETDMSPTDMMNELF